MDRRRNKQRKPVISQRKTESERQRTREEVEQIKRDLINFAKTSWGKQWIQSNLKIGRPFRMQRGIEYVKDKRRIDNLSINPGQIFATVQGTAPTPYRVKIKFETIQEDEWKIILKKLTNKTINLIELLEGSLPEDLITIFNTSGYSLFPDASKGLNATCSCPDKAIPCKHIAAVILYLALVIDFNPFLLLEFRGKPKSEILTDLSLAQSSKSKKKLEKTSTNQQIEFNFNVPKISIQELLNTQKEKDDFIIDYKLKKPGKIIETLENLGIPQNIENKAFEIVLRAIYKKITSETYSMSSELNK
ncbi:MAG: SWIM zinc finger family protein [Candidatus Lokiarchaeota archaeon]|nr:SWIM zinc finger family protein [Candidatus Lokiarchaeota archaeon]MCK4479260.1 SWIM zinc finger family protein [Candidatus Lokiarchaeota archaeon]